MKGTQLLTHVAKYLERHSPVILSGIGAVGVITTATMAVKATPKALEIINEASIDKTHQTGENTELTKAEVVKVAWKCYIPAVVTGTATIACIFGANVLNRRQQAALTSAYIFLNRTYKDYKAKVTELYGEGADRNVRSEIVKDKCKQVDIRDCVGETLLFYEEHYGKFFQRTMLEVQDAEYQLNRKLAKEGEASLNDFFELLGLDESEIGDALGWSQETICDFYNPSWIDFEHELVTMDDGMECYIINILVEPTAGYDCPF